MYTIVLQKRISAEKSYFQLYVDSLSDLSDMDTTDMVAGSIAYDKAGDLAILDSNGNWNTVQ